jgi:hypothetical protein
VNSPPSAVAGAASTVRDQVASDRGMRAAYGRCRPARLA